MRPNILYIMSDDHATNAISAYGSRLAGILPTPHIDRIGNEGVRSTHCFCTNAICTPSRAVILTGQYSQVNGVYTLADALDPKHPNVAKVLQESGYQTAMIGKWHLKNDPAGFDYWNVLPGQGKYFDPVLIEHGTEKTHEGYCTDIVTDFSLDWLKKRDKDKPFFLMSHHKAPHGKWEYHPKYEHLFDDVEIPEPDSLWEDKSHRSEATRDKGTGMLALANRFAEVDGHQHQVETWPTGRLDIDGLDEAGKKKAAYQKYLKDYLRTVASIDENVGRLLDYLDEEGIADNTVVIYTSDQGMFLGEHDYYDKRWMYEEALQMPFLMRYPKEIAAGSLNDDMLVNIDFAPTFLDYAEASTPDDMQGVSFRANVAGNSPDDWREAMYYRYWMHMQGHDNPAHYGIRTKKYKLIFFYGLPLDANGALQEPTPPGWELYDLEKDPYELNNVYNNPDYSSVISELKSQLAQLKEKYQDTDDKYPELEKVLESCG